MEELKSRTPTIVRWITPPSGRLKLNVDGAFMRTSGTTGGGGILRDHEGNMCWAFARAYHDLNSSLAAEAMALNGGLSICCSKGVSEVLVETDSLNLLQLVTNQISSQWDLSCIMHDIAMKTLNLKAEIAHVPREANRVADCLASSAMSCTRFVIWSSWGDLPTTVKDPYHLDKVKEDTTSTRHLPLGQSRSRKNKNPHPLLQKVIYSWSRSSEGDGLLVAFTSPVLLHWVRRRHESRCYQEGDRDVVAIWSHLISVHCEKERDALPVTIQVATGRSSPSTYESM
ncbi:hypothetical protein Taro_050531 [Colocasia esculenta]|uniref:RNase H type-1 domain-containing protein n=1 Tax=Colocasia esculenta TaxID=4460 RepID=A0A843XDP7_COLES|nr:hypothetical protein [Colocasia esculenta]